MGDHNKKTTVDVKKAEKEKEAVESQFAVLKNEKVVLSKSLKEANVVWMKSLPWLLH